MIFARFALAALLFAAPATVRAAEFAPGCDADLAKVDESFQETMTRLEGVAKGTEAEKCAAYRHHVDVMTKGIEVFMRCMPEGHDQREHVGQLAVSIEDFNYMIEDKKCAP